MTTEVSKFSKEPRPVYYKELDALGFDRERSGMALGWTTGDSFRIETTVSNFEDPATGDFKPEIYVSWTKPHYIYDDVEFDGRYSVFGN